MGQYRRTDSSGTMQFWIDFLAVEKCNGVQNENIVTVTGTYQGYQIVDSAMLRINRRERSGCVGKCCAVACCAGDCG